MKCPVIYFDKAEKTMVCSRTIDLVGEATPGGVEWFTGLEVIDSEGQIYRIGGAHVLYPRNKFLFFLKRLVEGRIKVQLHSIEHVGNISLDQLKERVCEYIDLDPDFWSEAGDIEELKVDVRQCRTHREVIDLAFLN